MLRRVDLVRTDVSEERSASFISVARILVPLMKEVLRSSEMSVITRATRRNIPEATILHSHRRENLKSYLDLLFISKSGSARNRTRELLVCSQEL
jgi:hypothetical protein